MAVPLDAIRAIHNAFRKDMAAIDAAADEAARGRGGLGLVSKRYAFFNQALAWHADGEEEFVFSVLESVAPLVAEAYERDHRGLDSLYMSLHKAVTAPDPLATARATAAFNFHLSIHLDKEEAHLYRIFNERVSLPNQGVIMGKMAQKIPQERFPEVIGWLYPLLGHDDRENMTRIWRQSLPEPAFTGAIKLVRAAIGDDWADLTRRIPELK
jgi:hemerythrin-like domain-containing protein